MSLPRRLFETTLSNLRYAAGMPLGAALAVDAAFIIAGVTVFTMGVGPPWIAGFLALIGVVGVVEKTVRRVR
jgi:hypothetical protein